MAEARSIKVEGTGLRNGVAEGPNKFVIYASEKHDVSKIQIGFDGPGQPECRLNTKKDKSIDVTYTSPVAGEYKIHVRYDDKPIPGSPFKCKIIGDVKGAVDKVKASGDTKEGKVNVNNTILVDGREVGILGRSSPRPLRKYRGALKARLPIQTK
ncbi:filamin-B isoform X2 [Folsomia candida]|uniref:filamin-B isoform X2 n=1 Tax=Folsomia candida TaxID=158441 RepID=UPI001604D29A|nr:filamin-B isoform X2 [Folsomia candida]